MSETETLDIERITDLTTAILLPIRANYIKGPQPNRDRVYEALNALAAAAGVVINGCGGRHGEAHQWFERALGLALKQTDLGAERIFEP